MSFCEIWACIRLWLFLVTRQRNINVYSIYKHSIYFWNKARMEWQSFCRWRCVKCTRVVPLKWGNKDVCVSVLTTASGPVPLIHVELWVSVDVCVCVCVLCVSSLQHSHQDSGGKFRVSTALRLSRVYHFFRKNSPTQINFPGQN